MPLPLKAGSPTGVRTSRSLREEIEGHGFTSIGAARSVSSGLYVIISEELRFPLSSIIKTQQQILSSTLRIADYPNALSMSVVFFLASLVSPVSRRALTCVAFKESRNTSILQVLITTTSLTVEMAASSFEPIDVLRDEEAQFAPSLQLY